MKKEYKIEKYFTYGYCIKWRYKGEKQWNTIMKRTTTLAVGSGEVRLWKRVELAQNYIEKHSNKI